ncbi:hypothetical protein DPMN_134750 [Dreissena polymorpha]|uniref:Uncharacterized protein n=2 Tax=Dreissena polymorpha TaxID=45954 RepID=A0A9D4FZK5_DREPO|nr:hypothetical protein DPMN_134750 [Dreissena polymorpha]
MFSELVLLTECTPTTINYFKEAHTDLNINISSPEDIKRNINLLLERYVCSVIGQMVDNAINDKNEIDKVRRTKPMPEQYHSQLVVRKTATVRRVENIFCDHERNGLLSIKRNSSELESGFAGSEKRFKTSSTAEEDRHNMDILLLDVKALFERSDVPKSEWPRFEHTKTPELNPKIVKTLYKLDPSVIGCGYQHNVLEIILNREINKTLDGKIIQTLTKNNIVKYHLNYGPCPYTPLAGIQVGTPIGRCGRTATLGGFAEHGIDKYALTARHFIDQQDGKIYYINNNGYSECIAVKTTPARRERDGLDIVAVRIFPQVEINDMRFKDSTRRPAESVLFRFQETHEQEIRRVLQGELVFAWTANSSVSPSVGRIVVPQFETPFGQYKYVVIVNDHAGRFGQEAFGKPGDSGAIVCIDDKDGNGVHVISMFMGKCEGQYVTHFLTLPLQHGLQQINMELGIHAKLC